MLNKGKRYFLGIMFINVIILIFLLLTGCEKETSKNHPSSPALLQVTLISSTEINLVWADNSNNENGFGIECKKEPNGTYSQVGKVGTNITTYQDKGLLSRTTYYYRIYAYNLGGNSEYSNEVSATTQSASSMVPQVKWEYKNFLSKYNINYTFPALDQNKGRIYFEYGMLFSECLVGDCIKSCLNSLDLNGEKQWEYLTGYNDSSPIIDEEGIIYLVNNVEGFYAINVTGTERWKYNGDTYSTNSPALGIDGNIYVGIENSFYKLDKGGKPIWEYSTDDLSFTSPAINNQEVIYIGVSKIYGPGPLSEKSNLLSFQSNGTLKWNIEIDSRWLSSPVIGMDDVIYLTSTDMQTYVHLYAVDPEGKIKWQINLGDNYNIPVNYIGFVAYPVVGEDGTIYTGTSDLKLYAINPDGTKKWEFSTGGLVFSPPLVGADGIIYAGSSNSKLYALNPDGTLNWEFKLPVANNMWSFLNIGNDGILYIAYSGSPYALNSDGSGLTALFTSSLGPANSPWPMFGHDPRNTGNQATPIYP